MIESSRDLARRARLDTVRMCCASRAAHVGSSLSVIDILAVIYSGSANVSPELMDSPLRDIVIVSKGHAAAGAYSVLAEAGFFPVEWLDGYGADGAQLGGHVTSSVPGVELSTGSLGHGLPFGVGLALNAQREGRGSRVFVVISDGECDEGSTWEAALFASHHGLDNLVVVIDRNGIQSLGPTEQTLRLEPLAGKWTSFGWHVEQVDGHNHDELRVALDSTSGPAGVPTVVIGLTTKGKGVSFMEDQVLWHYRPPSTEDVAAAVIEINEGP